MDEQSEVRQSLKRRFAEFLEKEFDHDVTYARRIDKLFDPKQQTFARRLIVEEHHLREYDESLLRHLLDKPSEAFPAFEDAIKEYAKASNAELAKQLQQNDEIHVGLKGNFGRNEVSPRELSSSFLGKTVSLFGIVTKCSLVRPKVVKSVHYCEVTKSFMAREYRDVTASSGLPTGSAYPQRDDNNNLLTTEYGLCRYRDSQMISIQELPETAPPGQLPHSAEVILENDLVDKCKPGDRISVVGVYKAFAGKSSGTTSGVFKAVLVGCSVQKLSKTSQKQNTQEEVAQMRTILKRPDALDLMARSLAPSIYGHNLIKKGLLLMLVGGLEKNLDNGTHLRGDINVLLVGDPGVAKSQLLRAVMSISNHAISTTGRGSTGVGLTAAVTTDNDTGEKRLEAGAMVLADRGIVCIDEFDKMSDQDRVAIHEVMEQQTVTIAKAGIHTTLNARCSVLAAANPLYGSYDRKSTVTRNVNLPDSLLSRFDMLFVVLDQMNDARDKQVALHVLRQHRYRAPGEDGKGATLQETIHDRRLSVDSQDGGDKVFMKMDTRLANGDEAGQQYLAPDFLRKTILFCRKKYLANNEDADEEVNSMDVEDDKPRFALAITQDSMTAIQEYYTALRSESAGQRALPVTARTLESIIRISSASAKLRLSQLIEPTDVEVAKEILDHVLRKEQDIIEEEPNTPPQEEEERYEKARKKGARSGARSRDQTTAAQEVPADNTDAMETDDAGPPSRVAPTVPEAQRTPPVVPPSTRVITKLSKEQEAVVIQTIGEMTEGFERRTLLDLKQYLHVNKGLDVAEGTLTEVLQFVSDNYDKPQQGRFLPQVFYDGEAFNNVS